MKRLLILSVSIGISTSAFAMTSLAKYQPANGECETINASVPHLITPGTADIEVLAGRVSSTLEVIKTLRSPGEADVKAILPALKSNFENNFEKYTQLIASDCTAARTKLSLAMINSLSKPRIMPQDKAPLLAALKDDLKKLRYPTYASANDLATSIAKGAEKGIWKISPEDQKILDSMRADLKNKVAEIAPKLQESIKLATENEPDKLRTNRKFQATKKLFVNETVESDKYLEQLYGIIARLQ